VRSLMSCKEFSSGYVRKLASVGAAVCTEPLFRASAVRVKSRSSLVDQICYRRRHMSASPHGLLRPSKESTLKAPSSRRNFLGGSSFERQSAGHLSSSQRGKDGQLTATEQL